jgi:hypothetical protein
MAGNRSPLWLTAKQDGMVRHSESRYRAAATLS